MHISAMDARHVFFAVCRVFPVINAASIQDFLVPTTTCVQSNLAKAASSSHADVYTVPILCNELAHVLSPPSNEPTNSYNPQATVTDQSLST